MRSYKEEPNGHSIPEMYITELKKTKPKQTNKKPSMDRLSSRMEVRFLHVRQKVSTNHVNWENVTTNRLW